MPRGSKIVDVPDEKKIYLLDIAGPHSWRAVYMDGRQHPADLRPTYLGHSIGHWDGDTLVIDTVGLNEKQWMAGSYPSSEHAHLVERISRPNLKTLSYQMTLDDPEVYSATVDRQVDDHRNHRVEVDRRRRDVRIHLSGFAISDRGIMS